MCFLSKSRKQFLITSGVRKCLFTKSYEEKFEAKIRFTDYILNVFVINSLGPLETAAAASKFSNIEIGCWG